MGQVLLCHPYKAKIPYTVKATGTRVFTYEELCFFIYDNLDIIDGSIIDHDLNQWLDLQLEMKELSVSLENLMKAAQNYFKKI